MGGLASELKWIINETKGGEPFGSNLEEALKSKYYSKLGIILDKIEKDLKQARSSFEKIKRDPKRFATQVEKFEYAINQIRMSVDVIKSVVAMKEGIDVDALDLGESKVKSKEKGGVYQGVETGVRGVEKEF